MKSILIASFPLSPSDNELYYNMNGVGRVASKELREYKKLCEAYALKNAKMFREVKSIMANEWKGFSAVKADYFFVFKRERLYCKDGRVKKLDSSNRIKAVQDCLFNILGLDDKFVFAGSFEKLSGELEACNIVLSPHTPLNAAELLEMFQETSDIPKLFS